MAIALGGCGLKGDLYLPEPPAPKPGTTAAPQPAGEAEPEQDEETTPDPAKAP